METTSWFCVCPICLTETKNGHIFCSRACANEKARLILEEQKLQQGKQKKRADPKGPTLDELRKRLAIREQEVEEKKTAPSFEECRYDGCKKVFARRIETQLFCSKLCKGRYARAKEQAEKVDSGDWAMGFDPYENPTVYLVDWQGRQPDLVLGF